MKRINEVVLLICSVLLLVSFVGCERKGTAEKAGEKIDKVAGQIGDKVQDAMDATGKKVEEAGEKMQK